MTRSPARYRITMFSRFHRPRGQRLSAIRTGIYPDDGSCPSYHVRVAPRNDPHGLFLARHAQKIAAGLRKKPSPFWDVRVEREDEAAAQQLPQVRHPTGEAA